MKQIFEKSKGSKFAQYLTMGMNHEKNPCKIFFGRGRPLHLDFHPITPASNIHSRPQLSVLFLNPPSLDDPYSIFICFII